MNGYTMVVTFLNRQGEKMYLSFCLSISFFLLGDTAELVMYDTTFRKIGRDSLKQKECCSKPSQSNSHVSVVRGRIGHWSLFFSTHLHREPSA